MPKYIYGEKSKRKADEYIIYRKDKTKEEQF